MYSDDFKLSKNSFKFIRKAKWNNLLVLSLRTNLLNLDNCNLNDESLKIFVKCTFPSIKVLNFGDNCFSDKHSEIFCELK